MITMLAGCEYNTDHHFAQKWCDEQGGQYWDGNLYGYNRTSPSCVVPVKNGVFTVDKIAYRMKKEIVDYQTGLILIIAVDFKGNEKLIATYVTKNPDIEPHRFSNR